MGASHDELGTAIELNSFIVCAVEGGIDDPSHRRGLDTLDRDGTFTYLGKRPIFLARIDSLNTMTYSHADESTIAIFAAYSVSLIRTCNS